MISDPVAIRFRLSASQISTIWPGLNFIVRSNAARREGKRSPFVYPFGLFPPPPGFDRGTYHVEMMNRVIVLHDRLLPKATAGGRVHMTAFEIRAAIFAVGVGPSIWRMQNSTRRRTSIPRRGLKSTPVDARALKQLHIKSKRTILSLERHMKRANRRLLKSVTHEEYAAQTHAWKAHVRWMRLRLVYFKPWRRPLHGWKTRHQRILNTLVAMADKGLRNEGYQPPDAKELRRIMRLFAASARRVRQGKLTIQKIVRDPRDFPSKRHLALFVLKRLRLKRMKRS